jgi:hypothetical protein
MKTFLLASMMLVLAAANVHGQDIQYQGETSKGGRIQFVLTTQSGQQCVAQLQGTYKVECPLGRTQTFGYSIGTCLPLQKDGSFEFHWPLFPLSQFTFDILGGIAADGGAEGSLGGLYAALTFLDDPDCEVCKTDETWTASPVPDLAEEMKSDAFHVFLSVDKRGRSRVQFTQFSNLLR